MSSKAQVDFMETFMVLAVIFIILAIGIYFFFKFTISSTQSAAEDICQQTSAQMIQLITSMPEIRCTQQGFEEDCIDVAKLIAYQSSTHKEKLKQGNCPKSVTFEILYPQTTNKTCATRDIQSIDFPENCNTIELYQPSSGEIQNKKPVLLQAIISLYFPESEQYRLGRISIGAYQ